MYNQNAGTSSTAFDWRYEYAIRDHLGNTRLMFTDKDGDGTIEQGAGEILQENHYYPFGMRMDGRWQNDASVADNAYQYNGKELNEDFGLDWLDYGARWYDPAVGRWGAVDPLAGDYESWSPFNYVLGNPIGLVDPDGMAPCGNGGGCDNNAGGAKKKKRIKIRLPIQKTTKMKSEWREVGRWESTPSKGSRGRSREGKPTITYSIPETIDGQRQGDRQRVMTDPAVKVSIGSIVTSDFDATVTDGDGNNERPLYNDESGSDSGAGLGDMVTVTPNSKPGDNRLNKSELASEQNRRMERLTLSVVNERQRQVAVHKKKLFGLITLRKKPSLVPEGRNPK